MQAEIRARGDELELLGSAPALRERRVPALLGSVLRAAKLPLLEHLLVVRSAMLLALCTLLFANGYWLT